MPQREEPAPKLVDLERKIATQLFESTIATETANLVPVDQMRETESEINKLLAKLREANRSLQEAIEMDERKHTIKLGAGT